MNVNPPAGSGPLSVTMPLVAVARARDQESDQGGRHDLARDLIESDPDAVDDRRPEQPRRPAGSQLVGDEGRADQAVGQAIGLDVPETHAEVEREVLDRFPRVLDEPLPDRRLRLLLGLQVGLLILVVVPEQGVGERMVRVERVDVHRGLRAEVEAALEARALRPLARRVELVEQSHLEQMAALRPGQRVDDRIAAVARGDGIARVVGDGRP